MTQKRIAFDIKLGMKNPLLPELYSSVVSSSH